MTEAYKLTQLELLTLSTAGSGITDEIGAFTKVPLVNRAVNIRADSLASVPVVVYEGEEEVDWPFPVDLKTLLWQTQADLLIHGCAFWLKVGMGKRVVGVKRLNPFSVSVVWDGRNVRFAQYYEGKGNEYTPDEIIYFRVFNPADDVQPGKSAISVCMGDAKTLRYINVFTNKFFESGGMPVTIISVDPRISADEVKRTEGMFKKMLNGIDNAWRTIVLRSDVKPTVLTQPVKDMMLPELITQARQAIALAFGIPQTMLEDAANYATATEHRLSFWQDTVRPAAEQIAAVVNEQLFGKTGLRLEFAFEQMDMFQEDEAQRASSLGALTNAGVPLLTAMEILGYDLTDEQIEAIEEANGPKEPEPEPVAPEQPADAQPLSTEEQPDTPMREDMRKWQRKSLKALASGKSASVDFMSDYIPAGVQEHIKRGLEQAQDADAVRGVFASADMSGVIAALREVVTCLNR